MLRVKVTEKTQVVKPKDLHKTLDSLVACGYGIDSVAVSGFWFWKKHTITFCIYTAPSVSEICDHIQNATLANRNIPEVYNFLLSNASFYRRSHLELMRELFDNKDHELTQQYIKLTFQPRF